MWFAPIERERILWENNLSEITFLINNLSDIENRVFSLLNKDIEKENPIYDENDYEYKLISTDENSILNKWETFLDYEIAILEKDLKDETEEYLLLLKRLLVTIDNSVSILVKRTSDNYINFYKLKSLDIFEELNTKENLWDSELQKLSKNSIDNPYKIVFKEYSHFHSIISLMHDNIEDENNIIEKWNLVASWLQLNLGDFKNLKKWEDNIIISWYSIDSIIDHSEYEIRDSTKEVENILKSLWVKKV